MQGALRRLVVLAGFRPQGVSGTNWRESINLAWNILTNRYRWHLQHHAVESELRRCVYHQRVPSFLYRRSSEGDFVRCHRFRQPIQFVDAVIEYEVLPQTVLQHCDITGNFQPPRHVLHDDNSIIPELPCHLACVVESLREVSAEQSDYSRCRLISGI